MPFDYHEHRTVEIHAYSESLTADRIQVFKKFAAAYMEKQRPLAMRDFMKGEVDRSQYGNFKTLQYFGEWTGGRFDGLAELTVGARRWMLTEVGRKFFVGELGVLSPIGRLNGNTIPDTHPAWETYRGRPRERVFINDIVPESPKSFDQYHAEVVGDTLF